MLQDTATPNIKIYRVEFIRWQKGLSTDKGGSIKAEPH